MEDKKYIKFDIPKWVEWLARDGSCALYGYLKKPRKCIDSWGIGQYVMDVSNSVFITDDPEYYPQVRWEDEEPSKYEDGITVADFGTHGLLDFHTDEAITALQNFGKGTVQPEPDMIQNPPHYKQYSFEPIDIITEVVKEYPPEIGFHVGTVLKYLFRSPFKGNLPQDLDKAEYYLQRANKELSE